MSEAKPTPGPWWIDEHGGLRHGVAHARDTVPVSGVALLSGNVSERVKQAEANRDLLFEAGTAFHTTGLTPSQLVERVKELEELLNGVLLMGRGTSGRIIVEGWQEEVLHAALSKAHPNTAEGEAAQQAPAVAPTWEALHYAWQKIGADVAGLNWGAFTHAVHYAPQATTPAAAKEPSP